MVASTLRSKQVLLAFSLARETPPLQAVSSRGNRASNSECCPGIPTVQPFTIGTAPYYPFMIFDTGTPNASAKDLAISSSHFLLPRSIRRIVAVVNPSAFDNCHCVMFFSCRTRRIFCPMVMLLTPFDLFAVSLLYLLIIVG